MSEPQAPDSPQRQESAEKRPVAGVFANFAVAAGPVATLIALVAAGLRAFAVCLIASGALIAAATAAYQLGQTEWYNQRSNRLRSYAFYVLGATLVAVGIPALVFAYPTARAPIVSPSRSSSAASLAGPAGCAGKPQISGADTPSLSFVMAITLPCAWPSGDQLWLVTQVLVAGQPSHYEYYFYASVKNSIGKLDLPITVDTCADRQWYLIAVTSEQLIQLQELSHTGRMAYYGNTFDAMIREYIVSNVQNAHTCSQ